MIPITVELELELQLLHGKEFNDTYDARNAELFLVELHSSSHPEVKPIITISDKNYVVVEEKFVWYNGFAEAKIWVSEKEDFYNGFHLLADCVTIEKDGWVTQFFKNGKEIPYEQACGYKLT